MSNLWQDLRYAVRVLGKSPGFTAAAVITLALGIGANTAIFSVVNAVLLRHLPYRDPDRLVSLTEFLPAKGITIAMDSDYFAWNRQNHVFQNIAAYSTTHISLTGTGEPERLEAGRVTAGFFSVLGIEPTLGRSFLAEEDRPGGPQVCVLSHELWRQRFGADRTLVGRVITLDGKPYTVVGVLPAHFEFVDNHKPALYMPYSLRESSGMEPDQTHMFIDVIARLKPGVTIERARSDLAVIGRGLQAGYKGGYAKMMMGAQPQVIPLRTLRVGEVRPALLILFGAVGFVLLIACTNVANLQLTRALVRQKEIAMRSALGAGRWRLARQLLTECMLLAVFGGGVGMALSTFGVGALRSLGPAEIPYLAEIGLDYHVLLFTALVSIATGVIFGLLPVLAAIKTEPNEALKEGGSRLASGRVSQLLRGGLTVAELALATVLLTGSGLLIRSFVGLMMVNPGLSPHHVLTAAIDLPETEYPKPEQQSAFFQNLLPRLRSLPGVISAETAAMPPLGGYTMSAGFEMEGIPREVDTGAFINIVSPGYFRTMGVPLIAGRIFTASDNADALKVAIVNQAFVRKFLPNENAIGKRIRFLEDWSTIVGVVGDVRQSGLASLPQPEINEPFFQAPDSYMTVVIRTSAEPLNLAPALRSQVQSLDANLPVFEISSVERDLAEELAGRKFNMLLLGIFAALALVLAVVGINGVLAYNVTQQTREIGIRMALGAPARDMALLILRRGVRFITAGVVVGLAGAWTLTRLMASLLYGVKPTDPLTFAAVSTTLVVIALFASYLPARRAAKVDPMVALRYE